MSFHLQRITADISMRSDVDATWESSKDNGVEWKDAQATRENCQIISIHEYTWGMGN